MTEHFVYTDVRSDPCTLTWRIEKFSMHAARKKAITSPVFESTLHRSQWCLTLNFHKHEETVDMILARTKSEGNEQYINFSLFVVGRLWSQHKSKDGEIMFEKDTKLAKLGRINLEYFMGDFCQLTKLCLLPNDTLTLRCEMVVSEDGAVVTYKSREEYGSHLDIHSSHQHSYAEVWKYIFPPFFLVCLFVGVLLITGFRSTIALISACLLLSLLCFNFIPLASLTALLWDLLFLYLERLVSNHFPPKQRVD